MKEICKKEIDFSEYDLSPCAVNLLKRILEKDPEDRIHIKEALSSPFILKNLSKKNLIKHQKHNFSRHQSSHIYEQEEEPLSDNNTSDD